MFSSSSRICILVLALLAPAHEALAQSSGGFVAGQQLQASALNQALQNKVDYPLIAPASSVLGVGGVTFSGVPSVGYVPIATSPTAAAWTNLFGTSNTWTAQQFLNGGVNVNPTTGAASLTLNPTQAAQQALIYFNQTGTGYWQIGKQNSDNSFFLFDSVRAANVFQVNSNSTMLLMNGVETLTFGGGLQIGSPTGGDKGAGTINIQNAIWTNGAQGVVSKTCTVNQALTLIFTNGILTGGTCNS